VGSVACGSQFCPSPGPSSDPVTSFSVSNATTQVDIGITAQVPTFLLQVLDTQSVQITVGARNGELSQLLALWRWEIEDVSLLGRARLLRRMQCALRIERQRAIAGHWAYDLSRHARLADAYRRELLDANAQMRSAGELRHQCH
jgi:hypothetical protein